VSTELSSAATFDVDGAWQLHEQVSVRPERFGALLYHYGTRRLSFLKSEKLHDVVRTLAEHPTARSACASAGVSESEMAAYEQALAALASSDMISERR
jgi:putative mycofactocin binding protein MftB